MQDKYKYTNDPTGSVVGAKAVTPSDTADIVAPYFPRTLYVGAAGDVAVVHKDGSEVTYTALPAGVFHPISAVRVKATGTTATGIVVGW